MKNNRVRLIRSDGCDQNTVRARNRLIRLYNAVSKNGGWRTVQKQIGSKNVGVVYNFAIHGIEPKNIDERVKIGLKNKCPTCKRAIKENTGQRVRVPCPDWMKR